MNERIMIGVAFLLGAAAGGVAGYMIAEKKIRQEADLDMQETRDFYKQRERDMKKEYQDMVLDEFQDKVKSTLSEDEEHPMDGAEEEANQIKAAEQDSTDIFMINEDAFEHDELGQDCETVWLYTKDRILAEKKKLANGEVGMVALPTNAVIGKKYVDAVCTGDMVIPEDEDGDRVFFVRNRTTNTDYEVYVMLDEAFYSDK